MLLVGFLAATDVHVDANSNGLPGVGGIQQIINWLMFLAVTFALAGFVVGVAIYVIGRHGGNPMWGDRGGSMIKAAVLGAFLLGVAAATINAVFHVASL